MIINSVVSETQTVTTISAVAFFGFNSDHNEPGPDIQTFTMPKNGKVYFGGVSAYYSTSGTGTCRIYKNDVLIDSRDSGQGFTVRTSMVDKSFDAVAGDVIKLEASALSGTATLAMIQAVIVY